jgi:hypothetical protein
VIDPDLLDDDDPSMPSHPRVPPAVSPRADEKPVRFPLKISQEYRDWLDREASRLNFLYGGHLHAQDVVRMMLEAWRERRIETELIPGQHWDCRGWRA